MIHSLTGCFTRTARSMSRALMTLTLAVLTALSLSAFTHANVDRVTYLHYDGLGSAIAATDEQGAIQWRENYQPYGQRTKYEATNHSVWFTGKPEEEDFALQYYGGRWYDPTLGRFNSIDPQGFVESSPMSFNRYAYGNNNPYSYVDPDGELPFLVPLAIFLVKEAAAEVASHYTDGWSDFLSVRRVATRGWRGVRNAFRRSGDDVPRNVGQNLPRKPIVVGENMERVQQYAQQIGGHSYRPWRNADPFDESLAMRRNERWIRDQVRDGREIIDIGPDFQRRAARGVNSRFYEMERRNLNGYGNYNKVFERNGRNGGVSGLDF